MIKLPAVSLDQTVLNALADFQASISIAPLFADRSAKAKTAFKTQNKRGKPTFDAVKVALTKMCAGARRCVYCEDSVADEVEHIYPKDLYPEKVFVWDNYVYACGSCNGPKNNQFAVFRTDTGAYQEVNPPRGQPSTEPPPGEAVLINPRTENPLDFALLDLTGTFKFVILKPADSPDYQRASYTFDTVLRLNHVEREFLRQGRQEAYGDYKARLREYVHHRNDRPQVQFDQMIDQLKKKNHPTVWREMQRQYTMGLVMKFDQDLHDLFNLAPEALTW